METMKFKTTIKCSGCVAQVSPSLDKLAGKGNWEVDLKDPERVLTVSGGEILPEEVARAVNEAGYKAEKLPS